MKDLPGGEGARCQCCGCSSSPSAPAQRRGRALIYAQNKLEPSVPCEHTGQPHPKSSERSRSAGLTRCRGAAAAWGPAAGLLRGWVRAAGPAATSGTASAQLLPPGALQQHLVCAFVLQNRIKDHPANYKPSTTCQVPQSKGFSLSLTLLRHFPLLPVCAFRAESCLPNHVTPTGTQPDRLHGLMKYKRAHE